jgi:TPR repeat protein
MRNGFLLFVTLLLGAVSAFGADFDKGLAAAKAGDYATVLREWKPLAEQGDVHVQFNLGLMYDNGQGVPQDYKESLKWYRLAAYQGYADAESNLGVMYAEGRGVPQDAPTAYMWWNIAAASGDKDATENRDKISQTMTRSQIEKGQDLTRACVAKNYQGC